MSEKSRFRKPFHKKHGKRSQKVFQSGWRYLYHIYWWLWTWFSWKKSTLVVCKILRLFVNTLTADDKYSLLDRGNLTQPVQTLLSQKENTFSEFFSSFLKSTLNFERFIKKDDPHSRCISEITISEKGDLINVWKIQFRIPFHKQHGKRAPTLLQSGWRYLYHIYISIWR